MLTWLPPRKALHAGDISATLLLIKQLAELYI